MSSNGGPSPLFVISDGPQETTGPSSLSTSSFDDGMNNDGGVQYGGYVANVASSVASRLAARAAETRAGAAVAVAWRRLTWQLAFAVWAFLLFVLVCVAAARAGRGPLTRSECGSALFSECERALVFDGDVCLRLPVADGTPCQHVESCYAAPSATSNSERPACRDGACVTQRCLGTCDRAADCPPLKVRGAPKRAACNWHTCVYTEQAQLPVAAADCSLALFADFCRALLDIADVGCMRVDPVCEAGQLVCVYSYECARALAPSAP